MAMFLSNLVEINYLYPAFKGKDLLEIKFIYRVDYVNEILGEFLLTKETALMLAESIKKRFEIS